MKKFELTGEFVTNISGIKLSRIRALIAFGSIEVGEKGGRRRIVYVLVNFGTTMQENLYRTYKLRELGYDPYVMVYNKTAATKEIRNLQRWCNNRIIFGKCKRFEDYIQ